MATGCLWVSQESTGQEKVSQPISGELHIQSAGQTFELQVWLTVVSQQQG